MITLTRTYFKYKNIIDGEHLAKGVDILHPTYYDTYYLPYLGKAKLVLTVYDMIHEKGMFPSNLDTIVAETVENKKKLVKHASKIVAISE